MNITIGILNVPKHENKHDLTISLQIRVFIMTDSFDTDTSSFMCITFKFHGLVSDVVRMFLCATFLSAENQILKMLVNMIDEHITITSTKS